jgi:hypothetical protein
MRSIDISIALAVLGSVAVGVAIFYERRMHRFRQVGVSYAAATFRRDGGWQRTDLFTAEGLEHQRRASRYALIGILCWIAALLVYLMADL